MRQEEASDLDTIQQQLRELATLDKQRLEILDDLKARGLLRSKGLVGEWGERIALALLGGELAPPSQQAYDLRDARNRRVQVKTLRSTPGNRRRSIGVIHPGYDVLLCVRLDTEYQPTAAFEISRELVESTYADKRASLSARLERHDDVRRFTGEDLAACLRPYRRRP